MAGEGPPAKRSRAEVQGDGVALFPGDEGSLAHIAAAEFFKGARKIELRSAPSFRAAFKAVACGEAIYAVMPVEQSTSGTLRSTYDLLVEHNEIIIVGELGVREVYCLCAKPGTQSSGIKRVLSHPHILEACSTYLEMRLPSADAVATRSTTEATRQVVSEAETNGGAIATREAAFRSGLTVLAEGIGNASYEETRYIVIRRRSTDGSMGAGPFPPDLASVNKRSAIFALRNQPGAIFKLLACFSLRDINVLKVETRPVTAGLDYAGIPPARLWDYLFCVDFAVPASQTPAEAARLWEALSEFSCWQRDLGSYPSCVSCAEKTAPPWSEMVDLMAH
mmetsp:Transcript_120963/g.353411  ORF Transcript_120963/g.353411 Transcript_120963/m.353411 type:complete len:336 (-) Transcript_120963:317-1324(-)